MRSRPGSPPTFTTKSAHRDMRSQDSVGRFWMRSGHCWSGCWLDPVANDPLWTFAENEMPSTRRSANAALY
jgi:hypothetical protein